MNKVVAVVLGWVVLSLASASALAAPKVTLGAAVGGPSLAYVDIPLWLQASTPTAATLQFDVQFNGAQLTLTTVTPLAALGAHELDYNVINSGNTLRIVLTPPGNNAVIPTGNIATVRFNLPSGAVTGSQTLHIAQLESFTSQAVVVAGITPLDGFIADPNNITADADGDGIPDQFEAANGLHPLDFADAAQDFDNDGLTNLAEFNLGTNLYNADTDGDGMNDKFETTVAGLNPLVNDANADLDGDGLSNLWEYKLGTSLTTSAGTPALSTTLSGQITQNTVLIPGTTYQVSADVEVVSGVTLTVGPGASLIFPNGMGLTINGTLIVLGTADAIVHFTSSSQIYGIWKGITFGATSINSTINFGEILWAQTAVDVTSAKVDVLNSHISNFNYYGIYFRAGAGGLIANNVIEQGGRGAIGIWLQEATPTLKGFSTTVSANVIRGTWAGIYVTSKLSSPLINAQNIIVNNQYGINVETAGFQANDPKPVVTGNSIYANTLANYRTTISDGVLDATNNWWGTTDILTIANSIKDEWGSIVRFVTFLDAENGAPTRGTALATPITTNMTLVAGRSYDIVDNVVASANTTLTLEAGAVVRTYGRLTGLQVDGRLVAQGTAAAPVTITSGRKVPHSGDWTGITLSSGTSGHVLDHVVVQYASNGISFLTANGILSNSVVSNNSTYGVYIQNASPTINASLVANNGNHGIYILNGSPTITATTVQKNQAGIRIDGISNPVINNGNILTANIYGIYVQGAGQVTNDPHPLINRNSIYGNTSFNFYTYNFQNPVSEALDATNNWWGSTDITAIESTIYDYGDTASSPVVRVLTFLDAANGNPTMGSGIRGNIAANTTLLSGATYDVLESSVVPVGVTMTIQPGATLRFYGKATTLRVDGTLVVQGTSTSPVKFTSNLATPAPGSWGGLEITAGSSKSNIQFGDIQWVTTGINVSGAQVLIRNCTIMNFTTSGISMMAGAGGIIADNIIDNVNGQSTTNSDGVYLINSSPLIRGNTITHNFRGVNIDVQSNPTIKNGNAITSNSIGISMYGIGQSAKDPKALINFNSIYGNIAYNFASGAYYNPSAVHIDATNNWWGTTDLPTIASKIYDNTDAPTWSPFADYVPFLSAVPAIVPEPINPPWDTDGDGMDDVWEMQNFGTLARDGTGDFNGNGISDLQEFLNGTDPRIVSGPGLPLVKAPAFGTQVTTRTPSLSVFNSSHEIAQTITYEFEAYSDAAMSQLVVKKTGVAEATNATAWTVAPALNDNTWYYWRARAFNTVFYSEWVGAKFFVNTVNDAPTAFTTVAPQDATTVATYTPTLQVNNSTDVDGDPVRYTFEVFADSSLTTRVASISSLPAGDLGSTSWTVDVVLAENRTYYWRAIAADNHGAQTASNAARFFVNTVNDAPTTPTIATPFNASRVAAYTVDLVANNAEDPEGAALTYSFEIDTVKTFDSLNKVSTSWITQGVATTQWTVTALTENTTYFWRVRAHDGSLYSDWSLGSFLVSVVNDPPAKPTVKNPGALTWIETLTPTLSANPVVDPEGDVVSYRFELYTNSNLSGYVGEFVSAPGDWLISSPLTDNSWYYWRVRAEDDMGATSAWTALSSFFVNNNGYDDPPSLTFLEPTADITATGGTVTIHWDDIDPDSNASIALYFNTTSSGSGGTLIVSGLQEDPDGAADSYVWDISNLVPGKYWVYAVIADIHSTVTTYAPHTVTVVPIERIVDNRDAGAAAYGVWPASTSIAGYLGVDYQYHAANGAAPGTLIIDNRDAGFSNPSGWPASSATAGYYGLDDVEKLVVPVSASSAGTVLDNSDTTFIKVGTWTAATTPAGFNGSNYLYHAASTVPPGTVVVDNTDTNVTKVGSWTTSTAVTGYYGSNFAYRAAGTGANKFTWSPKPATTDQYMVYARWTSSSTRATNARYTINYNGGSTVMIANQQANGGTWNLLGTYSFKAATSYAITLTDQANGVVIADAVMLVPVNAIYNSTSWNFSVTATGQYQVYGRWVAATDRATNATYTIANSAGNTTVAVNQQANGGTWVLLGIYNFTQSTSYSVKLTDQANGVVVADAVKLVKVPDPTSVSWSFTVPTTNTYNVYTQWSAATNRATDAKYTVNSATGAATIAQNQQLNGGTWNLLGTYTFNQSTAYSVSLSDQANGYVVGDAIKVIATNAKPNSFTWTLDIPKTGTYKVYSRWTAAADRATNSAYAIEGDNGNVSVVANQQLNGGQWNLLGTYHYTQGTVYRVTVTDQANGNVIADGVRIERVGP